MEHKGTAPLETPRLFLRRFNLDDAPAMFKNWANDDDVTKFLMWSTHKDVNETKEVLGRWTASYEKPDYYLWAIVPKDLGEPIGSIAAVRVDDKIEMVHIGYCIGRRWWRMGYMSEALAALVKFFFEDVGVNRIESRHDTNNPNSGAVMRKCGLSYEGTMRRGDYNNQGIHDSAWYAILKSDYMPQ